MRVASSSVLAVLLSAAAPFTALAASSAATTYHTLVPAAIEMRASTCPWVDSYPPGTICNESYAIYFRESTPSTLRDAPWGLYLALWTNDPNAFYDYDFRDGILWNPTGYFDARTLLTAGVAGTVPMSDGASVLVDLRWDMSGTELQISGNDGPYNQNNGIDRHLANRCVTLNLLAHQRYRAGYPGTVAGTLGDWNVADLFEPDGEPFVSTALYTSVAVTHGGCSTS